MSIRLSTCFFDRDKGLQTLLRFSIWTANIEGPRGSSSQREGAERSDMRGDTRRQTLPDLLADQLPGRKGISHANLHVNKSLVDFACAKRKEEQAKASITAHLSFVIHITLRTARTSQ